MAASPFLQDSETLNSQPVYMQTLLAPISTPHELSATLHSAYHVAEFQ